VSDIPARLTQPRILIAFAVPTIIWGSTWYVIRGQLGDVPPSWSVTWRFVVAAAAMFAFALARREPLRLPPGGQAFAIAMGVAQFVLNFNFVYRAEAHITSGLVAVIFALLMVPNALLGRIFLRFPLDRRLLIGSGVALVGVALLIVQEARIAPASGRTWLGVMLVLAGVLSASVANVMQATPRARAMAMAPLLAWGMLWGALIDAVVALIASGRPVIDLTVPYLAGVVYLGVFASAISFMCYFAVIRAIGPARAAYSGVITPVLAMVISTWLEGYRWSSLAVIGGILAMAGLVIALSRGQQRLRNPST